MISLALEMSSRRGSMALFDGEALIGQESWMDEGMRSQNLFELLPNLLSAASVTPPAIACCLVGRGPGSYTGLRVAITAAQALLLPGGGSVFALSSGEALAAEIAGGGGAETIAVMGNARRDRLWLGIFDRQEDGGVAVRVPWTLIAIPELPDRLPPGAIVASPEWTKLAPLIPAAALAGVNLVAADRYPSAEWVGRAGMRKIRAGAPSESMTPIYMHPAVAAAKPEIRNLKPE